MESWITSFLSQEIIVTTPVKEDTLKDISKLDRY